MFWPSVFVGKCSGIRTFVKYRANFITELKVLMLISVHSYSLRIWKTFCNSTKSHQTHSEKTRCNCPSSVRNRKDCHFFHCLTPIYWHNSSWNPSFVPLTDQRIGNTNSKGKNKIAICLKNLFGIPCEIFLCRIPLPSASLTKSELERLENEVQCTAVLCTHKWKKVQPASHFSFSFGNFPTSPVEIFLAK